MSTPSRKPVGPIDLSSYVAQRAREQTESAPIEGGNQPVVSPYAPQQGRERTDITRATADAPRTPMFADVPTPQAPVDLDEASRRAAQVADADQRAPERPSPERPSSERPQQGFTEGDIERLEASLRWLQREEAATRLLHSSGEPAAQTAADASDQDEIDDRPPRRFQSLRSLEPEHLVPPPGLNGGRRRWPLSILAASAVGAAIAYYFAAGDSTPPKAPPPRPQVASFDAKVSAPPPVTLSRPELLPTVARDEDADPPAPTQSTSQHNKTSRLAKLPETATVAAPQPATVPAPQPAPVAAPQPAVAPPQPAAAAPQPAAAAPRPPAAAPEAAPPSKPVRAADPPARSLQADEIALLNKQGEQFVANGDFVTARLMFQRAAQTGDANAAMALAATYDPLVLARLGAVGVGGDVEKARSWYQKAESLGAPEATHRLSLLANAHAR
jgi:TPR repeat protein